jgi:3-dehydroquinate synthase
VVVTNALIDRLHGVALKRALLRAGFTVKVFKVKDSERAKSMSVAVRLIGEIVRYSAGRKVTVVAFGGGVVGDLAGFVAAVIKRGVPFVQVPTTLLAQIDSAIGGKVAVDLPAGKNLVGAFYQPKLVLSDVSLLKTLSERQIRNGLAEAIKYGVIRDEVLFTFIEMNYRALLARDPEVLELMVLRCAAIKAAVVSKDEKETKGLRTILNFGHTVGHAIESAASYEKYHHGEAIALGMRVAALISCRLKLLKPLDDARLNCLLNAVGLPEVIKGVALTKLLKSLSFDKKFSGKTNRWVLARGIGAVVIREGVPDSLILSALKTFQS